MLFLLNEATFDELLDLSFDCLYNARSDASLLLFDRLSIQFDVETMHSHLRIETRDVFIASSKDIYIFFYQEYKVLLLRLQQIFTYRDERLLRLITHINLDYFIIYRRAALFKMLLPLKIKLLSPWISIEWLNVLLWFHLTG